METAWPMDSPQEAITQVQKSGTSTQLINETAQALP
jgi:hypothetical protein